MVETTKVSFKRIVRRPMCSYCQEIAASYVVVTEAGEFPACARCQDEIANGLHECDYTCEDDHMDMWTMPAQPEAQSWVERREWRAKMRIYAKGDVAQEETT